MKTFFVTLAKQLTVCSFTVGSLFVSTGHAQSHVQSLILQHDFSGSASDSLNGVAADVGGVYWVAGPRFAADGSITTGSANSAWLPFVPEAGKVYQLSAQLTSSTSTAGLSFGFVQSISHVEGASSRHADAATGGIAWILHRGDTIVAPATQTQRFFGGPTNAHGTDLELEVATLDVLITLDATDSDNVLVSVNLNDGAAGVEPIALGALVELSIAGVGFGNANQLASVANLQLT